MINEVIEQMSDADKLKMFPAIFEATVKANKLLAKWAETGGKITSDEWTHVQQSLANVLRIGISLEELHSYVTIDWGDNNLNL